MAEAPTREREGLAGEADAPDPDFDWREIARLVQVSRALDRLEEERLVPERKILYQFSARGHDMAQIMLGSRLDHPRDGACGYYRSRPLLLALGVEPVEALGSEHGPRRRLFGRPRYRRRLQLSQCRRLPGLADVRRRRRAIYADRGLGAGDRLSPRRARRRQL